MDTFAVSPSLLRTASASASLLCFARYFAR
ncbi:MAG: hypothetical protein KGH57_01090 [Candidatus Micrarchaeota archaeon]|nr:hypothetical protein [Candidatus Micrarchaeota archaeon]